MEACQESDASRVARVTALLDAARGADLIVLPELWRVGYDAFASYAASSEPLRGETCAFLCERARVLRAFVLGGTFVERAGERLYNTAVLVDPRGEIVATYRKMHLLDYQSQERTLLAPGVEPAVAATEIGTLGVAICYDLRFPELFRTLVERGAEVLLVPSAWPAARRDAWDALSRARAVENQAYVVACDGAGKRILGHSRVVDPWGVVVASLGERPGVVRADLDLAALRRFREEFPAWRER